MSLRACLGLGLLALGGMGCAAREPARAVPDDAWIDGVWACMARGDLEGGGAQLARIDDPVFRQRAALDLLACSAGRAAALVECLQQSSWLAARYDSSDQVALDRLRAARRGGVDGGALWLEEAHRSPQRGRQLSAARAAQAFQPGAAEALAVEIEALQAGGQLAEAEERLAAPALPETARLALARRRQELATGRWRSAATGVLRDLQDGRAVPASLAVLEDILARVPMPELEEQARAALGAAAVAGPRMERARDRLLARLLASGGRLDEAVALLAEQPVRAPADDRRLLLWEARLDRRPASTLEERVGADAARPDGEALFLLRLAEAWELAALQSYDDVEQGESIDLPAFLRRLDEGAAALPGAPSLASLPLREHGLFGALLDTDPLRERLPGALILAGKALGLPAELAWFDRQACVQVELPAPWGHYERCTVRTPRVRGYAASRGTAIAGAGIERVVYLDLDELELEERESRLVPLGPPLAALPAHGAAERRDLREPLDVVARLQDRSRRDAGGRYGELLQEALALHEEQHILDFRQFVAQGAGGKLALLLSGGLLPGAVRAEIERRAQLAALRTASDPRIPLAHALSYLPVDGGPREGEHARGYAALLAEFVERLDGGRWPGARSLPDLGLDAGRVLVQQLHQLPPETVRAIALAMDD